MIIFWFLYDSLEKIAYSGQTDPFQYPEAEDLSTFPTISLVSSKTPKEDEGGYLWCLLGNIPSRFLLV